MGFELSYHTADLAVKIWGSSLPELFQSALDGYRFLLVGETNLEGIISHSFSVESDDIERLLVIFLNRLIFLFDTEGFLPVKSRFEFGSGCLDAEVLGSNTRQDIRHCVKAATYHGLSVEKGNGCFMATVIFDD